MRKLYSVLLSFLLITSAFAQIPTNGLVSEWTFNNGNLDNGYGLTATLGGSPVATLVTDRFGDPNSAVDVNTGGFINFGGDQFDNNTTGSNATFAYSFWVKIDDLSVGNKVLLSKLSIGAVCQTDGAQYRLTVTPTGKLQLTAFGSLSILNNAIIEGNTSLVQGTWHHVVISVDMATLLASLPSTTGLTMYVDGTLQTNTVTSISGTGILPSGMQNGTAQFAFGTYLSPNGTPCFSDDDIDAHFDDFRIYNRTLDATDVAGLMNEGCDPAVITEQPQSQSACTGTVSLTCVAQGGTTSEMRWERFNGTSWIDAGIFTYGSSVSVGAIDASFNGSMWRVKLTSDCGTVSYSDTAYTYVGQGPVPTITLQPQDAFVCNSPQEISIEINPTGAIYGFYWERFNGLDWVGTGFQSTGIDGSTISIFNDLSGQVRVRIDELGCMNTVGYSNEITVDDMDFQDFTLNFDYGNGVVEANPNFDDYYWYYQGTYIPSAVGNTYSPTQNGDHELRVYLNGCMRGINFNWTGTVTGIVDASANGLAVYPNPFNSEFIIETTELTSISVMNAMGEVVLSRTVNGRTSIDATKLSAGVYFVREETSGAVMKLVKH